MTIAPRNCGGEPACRCRHSGARPLSNARYAQRRIKVVNVLLDGDVIEDVKAVDLDHERGTAARRSAPRRAAADRRGDGRSVERRGYDPPQGWSALRVEESTWRTPPRPALPPSGAAPRRSLVRANARRRPVPSACARLRADRHPTPTTPLSPGPQAIGSCAQRRRTRPWAATPGAPMRSRWPVVTR